MKFSELKDLSAYEVGKLSGKQLREAYQTVKRSVNAKVQTFKKNDSERAIPKALRKGLESSRGRSEEELLQDIRNALRWSRGSGESYAKYARLEEAKRKKIQERIPEIDLSTKQKLERYGDFINDMMDRYGESNQYVSSQARKLFAQSKRLNINPESFIRNAAYWIDHAEEIEKADPIGKGGRKIHPAEYARAMKLEKIGAYYDRVDKEKKRK